MSVSRLPCGCVGELVGGALVVQPCSLQCRNWVVIRKVIDASGMPLDVIMDPEFGSDVPLVHRCPGCGRIHDAHDQVAGSPGGPEEGSVGVCADCGAVFEFTAAGPRLLDPAEYLVVCAVQPEMARLSAAARDRRDA
jgi:hypothetical protein